ncbi:Rieske (2Fe-2S) protein [Elioraea sp. Yellowstone]|uniref:Rieske (2Fe-2S) protein n=1 Tax=Elioraea sp. Yellowstone TaxID=2592070 RepID=UPI0011547F4C|nr:Rieske (2Fe-2S) protein [Elioraea sp. Yellowstone]TQF78442.1 Rieske (2Fe-2S) protein [Elioraea sp. Yellowstone]
MTAAMAERELCRLEEIPDGGAKGFDPAPGRFTGVFAVRRGRKVWVYLNACPHLGVSLDIAPDRFLDARREHIQCSTHGALFRIEDGFCLKGPCAGERLTAIAARVDGDAVLVGPIPE